MPPEPHDADRAFFYLEDDFEILPALLFELLSRQEQGFKEYDLLKRLSLEGLSGFEGSLDDELIMFRQHFLLFHLLYRLRDQLIADQTHDLHIHCLDIRLMPYRVRERGEQALQVEDPLRAYYLDWNNCRDTNRQDVIDMIRGFHIHATTRHDRERAWDLFGLPVNAGRRVVKKRFRELVRRHHPDFGGDAEQFRRVMHAARILLATPRA